MERVALRADVTIVGHGLVGSVMAHCLLTAGARVIILDSGSQMSPVPAMHLRNLPECQADPHFYEALLRANLRPAPTVSADDGTGGWVPQPRSKAEMLSQRGTSMSAARLTSILGGMGTLWNGIAIRLDSRTEFWPGIRPEEWSRLYDQAERLLRVGVGASAGSHRQQAVLSALSGHIHGCPQPAPVAAQRRPYPFSRLLQWTGPGEILGQLSPAALTSLRVFQQHPVLRLRHDRGRVHAAEVVDLCTGDVRLVRSDIFVVAAGPIRTPGLLWASDIATAGDDASPLGRYLCDHPVAHARLKLNPELLLEASLAADPDPFIVIRATDERPFHSLLLCDNYSDQMPGQRLDARMLLSLYWYTAVKPRPENRIRFSGGSLEPTGQPRPVFEYSLDAAERDRQEAALADVRGTGQLLGKFLPSSPPQRLSPGSSMHLMGTTRMGEVCDGHSVVDTYGGVWGFENLYLGGTGLIPSATVTNPTLTACALAVRTASRIASRLEK